MQPFVIPTVFTAVNGVTTPLKGITTSLNGFAANVVKTAAITTAAVGGVFFAGKAMMDYQSEIANLSALTGASGSELDKFKDNIKEVATATKTSSVEVAKAFTAIANNQPELLKDAAALAAVTKSSILLAQASKMELQPAGEAVTQILNQYGKGAADAAKLVDILAAGSVAGSSEIRDTADAIQAFGTVAANAGVQINESVAMIELVSKFEKGTEAGTRLRNVLLEMGKGTAQDPKALASLQRLGVNINLVADATVPINQRLTEMSKIAKDNVAIMQVFGKENAALATGLLNNAAEFNKYLEAVNTSGTAAQMAATNNDTLAVAVEQLSGKFITLLTTSDGANFGMTVLKNTLQFITNNLDGLVTIVTIAGSAFLAWKGYILGAKVAIAATNYVMGIATVITGKYATACFSTTAGIRGMATASFFLEAGLGASLAMMSLVGMGILALGTMLFRHKVTTDELTASNEKNASGFVKMDKAITDAQASMALYNEEMKKYNEGQVGLKRLKALEDLHERQNVGSSLFSVRSWGAFFDEMDARSKANAPNLPAPKMSDFGLDSNGNILPATNPAVEQRQSQAYGDGEHASNIGAQRIELHINNNSGHELKVDETGAPGIKITSTTGSWT